MNQNRNIVCVGDNPYATQIRQFIGMNLAIPVITKATDLLDVVSELFIGTKQTRFGPRPNPETVVAIREIARQAISDGAPLPVMLPWGSEKPDGSSRLDIAELMALKQLVDLQKRMVEVYSPGLDFVIRVEDASAPYLYHTNQAESWETAQAYTRCLGNLIDFLDATTIGGSPYISLVPESSFVTPEEFASEADKYLHNVETALHLYAAGYPQRAEVRLSEIGWIGGGIEPETLAWNYERYERIYPEMSLEERRHILARYFTSAVARRKLKIRGDRPEWGGKFLDITFTQPIPGTENYFSRRVNYRTLPLSMSSNHIPPWRAKGYLEIHEDNSTRARLSSYHELPEGLVSAGVKLGGPDRSVELQADYVCV